jgi:hypothetical protein
MSVASKAVVNEKGKKNETFLDEKDRKTLVHMYIHIRDCMYEHIFIYI